MAKMREANGGVSRRIQTDKSGKGGAIGAPSARGNLRMHMHRVENAHAHAQGCTGSHRVAHAHAHAHAQGAAMGSGVYDRADCPAHLIHGGGVLDPWGRGAGSMGEGCWIRETLTLHAREPTAPRGLLRRRLSQEADWPGRRRQLRRRSVALTAAGVELLSET